MLSMANLLSGSGAFTPLRRPTQITINHRGVIAGRKNMERICLDFHESFTVRGKLIFGALNGCGKVAQG